MFPVTVNEFWDWRMVKFKDCEMPVKASSRLNKPLSFFLSLSLSLFSLSLSLSSPVMGKLFKEGAKGKGKKL